MRKLWAGSWTQRQRNAPPQRTTEVPVAEVPAADARRVVFQSLPWMAKADSQRKHSKKHPSRRAGMMLRRCSIDMRAKWPMPTGPRATEEHAEQTMSDLCNLLADAF